MGRGQLLALGACVHPPTQCRVWGWWWVTHTSTVCVCGYVFVCVSTCGPSTVSWATCWLSRVRRLVYKNQRFSSCSLLVVMLRETFRLPFNKTDEQAMDKDTHTLTWAPIVCKSTSKIASNILKRDVAWIIWYCVDIISTNWLQDIYGPKAVSLQREDR